MEIIQERLEREFNHDGNYYRTKRKFYCIHTTRDEVLIVNNPTEMPDPSQIGSVLKNHLSKHRSLPKPEYIGNIMTLCINKRGMLINQNYLTPTRVELSFEMPLS